MNHRILAAILLGATTTWGPAISQSGEIELSGRRITSGPAHHFFGYIGHVRTIPWSGSGRYLIALEADFQNRLPEPNDAARIVLLDADDDYRIEVLDRTLAWNPQQGTMLRWDPDAPDRRFFFNDRDPKTGKAKTVLYDIVDRRRSREFEYPETPFANGGVAQNGGAFLGLNYGRLARLRPVTGYPGVYDWTVGVPAPEDDGVFRVDLKTGEAVLLASFRRIRELLDEADPDAPQGELFINHTLWSRGDRRIYFFVRANWGRILGRKINAPFSMNADGSGLRRHATHIGGHPEWESDEILIGSHHKRQVRYDVTTDRILGQIGDRGIFPDPEGDIALSPDGRLLANGYGRGGSNEYVVYRFADGAYGRSRGFDRGRYVAGPLRIDGAPCWNRDGTQLLLTALADDGTRQLHLLTVREHPISNR